MTGYILIAGNEEGFRYENGIIQRHETRDQVREAIKALTLAGYKIFVVSEIIERVDEFIKEATE